MKSEEPDARLNLLVEAWDHLGEVLRWRIFLLGMWARMRVAVLPGPRYKKNSDGEGMVQKSREFLMWDWAWPPIIIGE